jgi:hypothetical protein
MPISFVKTLRAPIDRLLELAVLQCSRRKLPRLRVARTLPIESKMKALADWLDALHQRDVSNGAVLIALHGVTEDELKEAVYVTTVHAGFPRAIDAAQTLPELFAERRRGARP